MQVLLISLVITVFLVLLIKIAVNARIRRIFTADDMVLYKFRKFRDYQRLKETERKKIQDLYTNLTPFVSEDHDKALVYYGLFHKYFQGTLSDNDFLLLYKLCCIYNNKSKYINMR